MAEFHVLVDGGVMMPLVSVVLFVFGVIGMTHIVVDSKLFEPVRDWIKKYLPAKVASLITCYQCSGTWCGFLAGWAVISHDPLVVFVCGCAGSFLASWGAFYLNYLEAQTMIKMDEASKPETF